MVSLLLLFSPLVMSDSLQPHGLYPPALLSMGFPRQEHWSELPCPLPGESFWPKDRTHVSCVSIEGEFFTHWAKSVTQASQSYFKTILYLVCVFQFTDPLLYLNVRGCVSLSYSTITNWEIWQLYLGKHKKVKKIAFLPVQIQWKLILEVWSFHEKWQREPQKKCKSYKWPSVGCSF